MPGLLRRNGAFRSLAAARLISFVGDSLSLVALLLQVATSTGQALAAAALLLVGDFAPALLGPLTGALADRFDRRRLMVVCELVQGAVLVALALALPTSPLWLVLVLVGMRAVAGQVFAPASRAAVPSLVDDRDLESANSTIGFGANGAEAVGPLLLDATDAPTTFLIAGAAGTAATALVALTLPRALGGNSRRGG